MNCLRHSLSGKAANDAMFGVHAPGFALASFGALCYDHTYGGKATEDMPAEPNRIKSRVVPGINSLSVAGKGRVVLWWATADRHAGVSQYS